jgi:uncharacterized DUF497 family protein
MRFEWDEQKNRANRRKHGVSFETAQRVFDDSLQLSRLDYEENEEERWQTIGLIEGEVVLVVAHTYRQQGDDEIIRIISARKATRHERRHYEKLET